MEMNIPLLLLSAVFAVRLKRMATPSTQGANGQWRLTRSLTPALSAHIAELTALYHRVPGEEL